MWGGCGGPTPPLVVLVFAFFVLCLVFLSFFVASSITYLFALCFPYREGVQGAFFR